MCDYERFPNIGDYGNPITVVEIYGGVAEWSMAAVLKTVERQRSGGSNPSSSAEKTRIRTMVNRPYPQGDSAEYYFVC